MSLENLSYKISHPLGPQLFNDPVPEAKFPEKEHRFGYSWNHTYPRENTKFGLYLLPKPDRRKYYPIYNGQSLGANRYESKNEPSAPIHVLKIENSPSGYKNSSPLTDIFRSAEDKVRTIFKKNNSKDNSLESKKSPLTNYFTEIHGERRIDFEAIGIAECQSFVEKSIDRFMASSVDLGKQLMQEKGLKSKAELTTFLLENNSLYSNEAGQYILPFDSLAPNDGYFKGQQFYWDSYWNIKLLLASAKYNEVAGNLSIAKKRKDVAKGMIDNFEYLFDRLGFIPNGSIVRLANRSQPPFLTSMIWDVFNSMDKTPENIEWFEQKMKFAKKEYSHVWNNQNDVTKSAPLNVFNHLTKHSKLFHFGDRDVGYNKIAECESGEDFTFRFYNRAADFYALDNANLVLYEQHFAAAELYLARYGKGSKVAAREWITAKNDRIREINKYMWNKKKGYYYDFDYINNIQSGVDAIAGILPLRAGMVKDKMVQTRMVKKLHEFIQPYGATLTTEKSHPKRPFYLKLLPPSERATQEELYKARQWASPNDFANRKELAVEALVSHGFYDEAITIMENSIAAYADYYMNLKQLRQQKNPGNPNVLGALPEKINAFTGKRGDGAEYVDQDGFGWTNYAFLAFVRDLPKVYNLRDMQRNQIKSSERKKYYRNTKDSILIFQRKTQQKTDSLAS